MNTNFYDQLSEVRFTDEHGYTYIRTLAQDSDAAEPRMVELVLDREGAPMSR
jgi:hypothetical protein